MSHRSLNVGGLKVPWEIIMVRKRQAKLSAESSNPFGPTSSRTGELWHRKSSLGSATIADRESA
jgi:hypothetical protein